MKTNRPAASVRGCALVCVVCGVGAGAQGAPITILHSFAGGAADGEDPTGLILVGQSLYGTTYAGGLNGGTVYKIDTDGTDFSVLHSFSGLNVDGQNPHGNLVSDGSMLYGTTGTYGGTIFKIGLSGSGFSTMHTYPWVLGPGTAPHAGLALSGSTLYGTTVGTHTTPTLAGGTVFSIDTNGSNHTQIHDFTGGTDGQVPRSALTISGSTMYGMNSQGGADDEGTIFRMNTDGTGLTTLHTFTGFQQVNPVDGSIPEYTQLQLIGSRLFGITTYGGVTTQNTFNQGVLFAIDTDGTDFEILHSFGGGADGTYPSGSLAFDGTRLWGMTRLGGDNGLGSIYQINLDGSGYSVFHSFAGGAFDGAGAFDGGLIAAGGTLFGTTGEGGAYGKGVVFTLAIPGPGGASLCGAAALGLGGRRRRV